MKKICAAFHSTAVLFLMITAPVLARADASLYFAPVVAGVLPQDTKLNHLGILLTAKGKLGYGAGGLLGVQFSSFWGIEAGAIYLQRNYNQTGEFLGIPFTLNVNTQALHLPVGIRIHLGSFLSLEGGGYYDLSQTSDSGSNYGAQAGVRLSIPVMKNLDLFAEARHNKGFKDYGGHKVSDLALALVGITFGGHGK